MPAVVGRPGQEFNLDDDWIEEVAQTPDNGLRAHRIALTDSYVAIHLDELIHGGREGRLERLESLAQTACNANWFHFATWANRTVTQNLEWAPGRLGTGVTATVRRRLTPAVLQAKASQGQRVARALAWGQRLIFVATCLTLLEFSDQQENAAGQPNCFRAADLANCDRAKKITELATWGDRVWFTSERHFTPLWRAFELYELARQAEHPAVKARLVLGGNLLLMAVEQDLIGPALEVVVDNIPRRLAGGLDWRLARLAERLRGVPPQLAYAVLQARHLEERRVAEAIWARLMTDQILVMALPTETLRLGRDIPPRHREWPYFPPDLRDLESDVGPVDGYTRAALTEVARHVESIDRTAGDGRGSGARDWRRWDERMNWGLALLRSRQQDETLSWLPYSKGDQARIVDGELPLLSGDPSAVHVQPPIGLGVFPTAPAPAKDVR